jgi:translation initiation factor IF-3
MIAGACAVSFAGAFAVGSMVREDARSTPAAATPAPAPARARIATLAPAAGLPGLRAQIERHQAPRRPQPGARAATPQRAAAASVVSRPVAVAQRPVRRVTPVSRPAPQTPAARPQPAPQQTAPQPTAPKPAAPKPAAPKPSAPKPTVATTPGTQFFDDGG